MSFQRYSDYKESGVPWLGVVPARWDVQRFNAHTTTHRNSVTPEQLEGKSVLHYSIPTVQETGHGAIEEGASIDSNKLVVNSLQLLVSKLNPHKQVVVLASPHEELLTVASTEFVPLVPVGANVKYIQFVWQSPTCLHYLLARCDSATRSHQRVSPDDITKMLWAWPSQDEQAAIVTFLNTETSKIDALVAEQEELMALLKEKRQAVISHAVTKGLDPTVPMKGSGVEWLGDVPAHWEVRRVKDVAKLESGHTPSKSVPEYWVDCNIPWVSLNDSKQLAKVDYISDTEIQINALGLENSSARILPAGAVVFTRDATIGLAAITTRPMAVSQHLIAWLPKSEIDALYLLRVFNAMRENLDSYTTGATLKTIGMPAVRTLNTPVPPLEEQQLIAFHIKESCEKLESLIADVKKATNLLGERRSALISAAVTGKIDVRGALPC